MQNYMLSNNRTYPVLIIILFGTALLGSMTLPAMAQQRGDINWYKICTNPLVDILISESCSSLTTNGEYELTPAGQHALACIGGGTLATLTGNIELLSMGGAVGCGSSGSSGNDPIGSLISGLFN